MLAKGDKVRSILYKQVKGIVWGLSGKKVLVRTGSRNIAFKRWQLERDDLG